MTAPPWRWPCPPWPFPDPPDWAIHPVLVVYVDRHRVAVIKFHHHDNPRRKHMAQVPVTVGHKVTNVVQYFDANGNPMLVTPTPDTPNVWTDSGSTATPPIDTSTISTDGNTQTVVPSAAGVDQVGVTVVVAGKTFTASVEIDISAAPQVLTSIGIASTVS